MAESLSLPDHYKEQYYKELERKNELTNSLSVSIGIITALVALLFFVISSYSFAEHSISLGIVTGMMLGMASLWLACAIFHLIKALSNFNNGYDYAYVANVGLIDAYHKKLISYYQSKSQNASTADTESRDYIVAEFVKAASINRNLNNVKTAHRFLCHKYIVFSFIALCLVAVPVAIDSAVHKKPSVIYQLNLAEPFIVNNDSTFVLRLTRIPTLMVDDEKPQPPPTEILKEGKVPTTIPESPKTTQRD